MKKNKKGTLCAPWLARFQAGLWRCASFSGLTVLALAQSPAPAHERPVLQRGYDAAVSGATLSETKLNTSNVTPSTFGLVFTLPVDDAIFVQPLYVPHVVINHTASPWSARSQTQEYV